MFPPKTVDNESNTGIEIDIYTKVTKYPHCITLLIITISLKTTKSIFKFRFKYILDLSNQKKSSKMLIKVI